MYRTSPIHRRRGALDRLVERSNATGPAILASLRPMGGAASPRSFLA
jgi:hypothetical protein